MKNLFKSLGATDKETQAFLKMLQLGSQPISVIAKYVGVPRSSMYAILERLKKLHLTEEFKKNGITYIKCISVKTIADVLHSKERQIENALQIFEEKLPELENLENKLTITPRVKFFEGQEETMKIYEEVLREKEFYAVFNPKIVKRMMPEYVYQVAEILRKNNGKAKELVVKSAEADEYKKRFESDFHQIKILPEKTQFQSDTIICSDKIYMVSYGKNEVCATEIINPHLAQTQRALFELLWESIK